MFEAIGRLSPSKTTPIFPSLFAILVFGLRRFLLCCPGVPVSVGPGSWTVPEQSSIAPEGARSQNAAAREVGEPVGRPVEEPVEELVDKTIEERAERSVNEPSPTRVICPINATFG